MKSFITASAMAAGLLLFVAGTDTAQAGKRFVVPGPHAVSLAEEFRNGQGVFTFSSAERAGSFGYYCPGNSICGVALLATNSTKRSTVRIPNTISYDVPPCVRVAPGWKVINVEVRGTPKRWVSRGWREGDPRCLRAVISTRNTNWNRRDFSIYRVILEGPDTAQSFREAFDY